MSGDMENELSNDDNLREAATQAREDAATIYGVDSPLVRRIRNIQLKMRHALQEAGVTDPALLAEGEDGYDSKELLQAYRDELPPVIE